MYFVPRLYINKFSFRFKYQYPMEDHFSTVFFILGQKFAL